MATRKRKGVGYIRVSRVNGRDKDGDSFISPEIQRERILAVAKAHDVRIVAWYTDLDQSGKKEDRPGFQAAIEDVEAGRASVIVVARLSRFARSVIAVERALKRMEAVKPPGQLIAGDLNVDTTTPQGKLMRTILSAIAQFEVEVAEENWSAARLNAIARGVKLSGKVPAGYRRASDKTLEIDPILGPVVVEVFDRRGARESWCDLVKFWHSRTGQRVSRQFLRHLIQNRTYLGEVHSGDLVNAEAHPALVSADQFRDAQATLVKSPRKARGEGSLLAGILTCGTCGSPMTNETVRYRCNRKNSTGGVCDHPQSIRKPIADEFIETAFRAWASDRAYEGTPDGDELNVALSVLESARAEVVAFVKATSASSHPELLADHLADLEAQVDAAEIVVDQIRASGRVGNIRTSAIALWDDPATTTADRQKLLAAAIERAVVHFPEGRSSGHGVPFADRLDLAFRD